MSDTNLWRDWAKVEPIPEGDRYERDETGLAAVCVVTDEGLTFFRDGLVLPSHEGAARLADPGAYLAYIGFTRVGPWGGAPEGLRVECVGPSGPLRFVHADSGNGPILRYRQSSTGGDWLQIESDYDAPDVLSSARQMHFSCSATFLNEAEYAIDPWKNAPEGERWCGTGGGHLVFPTDEANRDEWWSRKLDDGSWRKFPGARVAYARAVANGATHHEGGAPRGSFLRASLRADLNTYTYKTAGKAREGQPPEFLHYRGEAYVKVLNGAYGDSNGTQHYGRIIPSSIVKL